jgi:hypothetical protein
LGKLVLGILALSLGNAGVNGYAAGGWHTLFCFLNDRYSNGLGVKAVALFVTANRAFCGTVYETRCGTGKGIYLVRFCGGFWSVSSPQAARHVCARATGEIVPRHLLSMATGETDPPGTGAPVGSAQGAPPGGRLSAL